MMRDDVATLPLVDKGYKTLTLSLILTCALVLTIQAMKARESGQSLFETTKAADARLSLPFKPLAHEPLTAQNIGGAKNIPRG